MNIQIERLKAKSIQFVMELVQKKLDDLLVSRIIEIDDSFKEIEILFKEIRSKEDLKSLKDFFKHNISRLPKDLYEDCSEELKEITDDLKWSKSKQGIEVLNLEEWVNNTRKHLVEFEEFKAVFIGRSLIEPTLLIVSGVLNNESHEAILKEKINQLNPPSHPNYVLEKPLMGSDLKVNNENLN